MKTGAIVAAIGFAGLLVHCGTRTGLDLGDTPLVEAGTVIDASLDSGLTVDDAGEIIKTLPDGRTVLVDGGIPACTFTQTDPHNCGACQHDCQGGACAAGVCQPLLLNNDESFPSTIIVDDKTIYWANRTDLDYGEPPASIVVRALPKAGGDATTLDTVYPGVASSMHQEGNFIYFYRSIQRTITNVPWEGSIMRTCKDGSCKATSLSGGVDNSPWEMAIDATRIFFPTDLTGGMSDIPKGGGIETKLASYPSFSFERLAIDDQFLYMFAVPNDTVAAKQPVMILRAPKDEASTSTPIMKGLIEGGDVLVDADNLYVSDTKQIYRLPKNGPDALTPVPIAKGAPGFMAMDADRVYWLEFADHLRGIQSSLHWARKDGTGTPGVMTLANDATKLPGVVVDDTSIYWAAVLSTLAPPVPAKGGIVRCTKPL